MNKYHIAFYIHHHGSGHIMRSLRIANNFKDLAVTFIGSNLKAYSQIIPDEIQCIHLPLDTPLIDEHYQDEYESCKNFHYAPLNLMGLRYRNELLVSFFAKHPKLILMVDTSAEIVALARLCGVAAVIMQQHGERNDLAHHLAYDSAIKIIAPFPKEIAPDCPNWISEKTLYAGGFSKFETIEAINAEEKTIGVLIGSGGTSINLKFVTYIASLLPHYTFKVIGQIEYPDENDSILPQNLRFLGNLNNPQEEMQKCEIIIGNAGHNTVMEVASLQNNFICIPEERPFFEQLDKANKIEKMYSVKVVLPENLYTTNWLQLITNLQNSPVNWGNLINANAIKTIRKAIDDLAEKIFI